MSIKKKLISSLMLSAVVLSAANQTAPALATTTGDLDKIIQSAQSGSATAKAQQDSLQKQVDQANAQLAQLQTSAKGLNRQVTTLQQDIAQRRSSLADQARSAQLNGGATSYIDTLLDSKSLTDAVQKITAMTEVVSANNQMLKQQQVDEAAVQQKLKDSTENLNKYTQIQQQLAGKEADLKVAQLAYQATITTATDQKNKLLDQEAAAKAAAEKLAESQTAASAAAAKAEAAASAAASSSASSANTSTSSPDVAVSTSSNGGTLYGLTPYYGKGGPGGECTAFAWLYVKAYENITLPDLGNGGQWASALGGSYGTPAVGDIVSFPPGWHGSAGEYVSAFFGHVAVVTSVNPDGSFTTIDGNDPEGSWDQSHSYTAADARTVIFARP